MSNHPTQYPKLLRYVGERYLHTLEKIEVDIFSTTRTEYERLLNPPVVPPEPMIEEEEEENKESIDEIKQEENQESSREGILNRYSSLPRNDEGKCSEASKDEDAHPVLLIKK